MKTKHLIIVILVLVLALLWCIFKPQDGNGLQEPDLKVSVIDCENNDSFVKSINSAQEGQIIKIVSDCKIEFNDLPAVISKDNITLDGNGRTITGTTKNNTLEITGKNVIVRNINFKQGKNGVVISNRGNAILINVSATKNKGTGLCVIGEKSLDPTPKYPTGKERLRKVSEKSFCVSSINNDKHQKNALSQKQSFSLFNDAIAGGIPSTIPSEQPTTANVCIGNFSDNTGGNGGEVVTGAALYIICGLKKVQFNNNAMNGLVVKETSKFLVIGSELEANDNTLSGLDLDDSIVSIYSNSKFNAIKTTITSASETPQRGIFIKNNSRLNLLGSEVTSSGNAIDLEFTSVPGDGSRVQCLDILSTFTATVVLPNQDKVFCPFSELR